MNHIEVTDEMVERADRFFVDTSDDYDTSNGNGWCEVPADELGSLIDVRQLLEYALNGDADDD